MRLLSRLSECVWRLSSYIWDLLHEGVSSSLFESWSICEHTGAIKETLRGGSLFPIHYVVFIFNLLLFYCSLAEVPFNFEDFLLQILSAFEYAHSHLNWVSSQTVTDLPHCGNWRWSSLLKAISPPVHIMRQESLSTVCLGVQIGSTLAVKTHSSFSVLFCICS